MTASLKNWLVLSYLPGLRGKNWVQLKNSMQNPVDILKTPERIRKITGKKRSGSGYALPESRPGN